jgi:hypothetical protein
MQETLAGETLNVIGCSAPTDEKSSACTSAEIMSAVYELIVQQGGIHMAGGVRCKVKL